MPSAFVNAAASSTRQSPSSSNPCRLTSTSFPGGRNANECRLDAAAVGRHAVGMLENRARAGAAAHGAAELWGARHHRVQFQFRVRRQRPGHAEVSGAGPGGAAGDTVPRAGQARGAAHRGRQQAARCGCPEENRREIRRGRHLRRRHRVFGAEDRRQGQRPRQARWRRAHRGQGRHFQPADRDQDRRQRVEQLGLGAEAARPAERVGAARRERHGEQIESPRGDGPGLVYQLTHDFRPTSVRQPAKGRSMRNGEWPYG